MRSRAAFVSGAMLSVLAFVSAGTGEALVNVDNTIHTGVFSIGSGQVARVHVQHVAGRGAKCEVAVSFVRAGGQIVGSASLTPSGGRAQSTEYTQPVQPGQSVRLRAVVELTPPADEAPNGNCIVSAEVADRLTGQTQFMIGDAVQFEIVEGTSLQ